MLQSGRGSPHQARKNERHFVLLGLATITASRCGESAFSRRQGIGERRNISFHTLLVDAVLVFFHEQSEVGCFSAAERFGVDSAFGMEGPKEERRGCVTFSQCRNSKMKARCPTVGHRTVGAGSFLAGPKNDLGSAAKDSRLYKEQRAGHLISVTYLQGYQSSCFVASAQLRLVAHPAVRRKAQKRACLLQSASDRDENLTSRLAVKESCRNQETRLPERKESHLDSF
jgi:hypothetical protein